MANHFLCKVECPLCGRIHTVTSLGTPIPDHPKTGELLKTGSPLIPCPGSGKQGIFIEFAVSHIPAYELHISRLPVLDIIPPIF